MTPSRSSLPTLLELQGLDSRLLTTVNRARSLQSSESVAALLRRRAQAIAATRDLDAAKA